MTESEFRFNRNPQSVEYARTLKGAAMRAYDQYADILYSIGRINRTPYTVGRQNALGGVLGHMTDRNPFANLTAIREVIAAMDPVTILPNFDEGGDE